MDDGTFCETISEKGSITDIWQGPDCASAFVSLELGKGFYNRGQNLWNNVKNSSKIGQDKKTLKSVFA